MRRATIIFFAILGGGFGLIASMNVYEITPAPYGLLWTNKITGTTHYCSSAGGKRVCHRWKD